MVAAAARSTVMMVAAAVWNGMEMIVAVTQYVVVMAAAAARSSVMMVAAAALNGVEMVAAAQLLVHLTPQNEPQRCH